MKLVSKGISAFTDRYGPTEYEFQGLPEVELFTFLIKELSYKMEYFNLKEAVLLIPLYSTVQESQTHGHIELLTWVLWT